MILKYYQTILKNNITIISIMSLVVGLMAIGSCATGPRVTLQGRTTYTSTGRKLMWDHRILDRQIRYSTISGRRAKLIREVMECATSRTDGLVSPSWEARRLLTKLRSPGIPDSEFYLNLDRMQRRCSQIKLYQYQQIIRFSLNRYRTGWKDPKQNYHIKHRRGGSPGIPSTKPLPKPKKVWTPRSIGKTQGTTRTMGRSSDYLSTMNRGNGRSRTIYSTTGGSQKRVSGLEQK